MTRRLKQWRWKHLHDDQHSKKVPMCKKYTKEVTANTTRYPKDRYATRCAIDLKGKITSTPNNLASNVAQVGADIYGISSSKVDAENIQVKGKYHEKKQSDYALLFGQCFNSLVATNRPESNQTATTAGLRTIRTRPQQFLRATKSGCTWFRHSWNMTLAWRHHANENPDGSPLAVWSCW